MSNFKKTRARVLAQNPDVRRFQRKQLTAFFIKLILIETVAAALTVSLANHGMIAAIPVGICLAIILPFWLLKPQKALAFGVRLGKVTNVKIVQRRVPPNDDRVHSYKKTVTRNFAIFTLQDKNGRTSKLELEAQFHSAIYEGDTLLRLSGVPYPVNLKRHTKALCPICGNIMPRESTHCVGCDADAVPTLDTSKE